jgi:hypothetical protein
MATTNAGGSPVPAPALGPEQPTETHPSRPSTYCCTLDTVATARMQSVR